MLSIRNKYWAAQNTKTQKPPQEGKATKCVYLCRSLCIGKKPNPGPLFCMIKTIGEYAKFLKYAWTLAKQNILIFGRMHRYYFFVGAVCMLAIGACRRDQTLFQRLSTDQTGIDFNNKIAISDSLNILVSEFIYNGGGVAIGDLNNDGLQDIYFTGNQVPNRLYLNLGGLRFKDITEASGAGKTDPQQWSSGINILDINRDGRSDIYVCNTFRNQPSLRRNLLFVNQGNAPDGTPRFQEMAQAYGIADTTHSPNAQFFDYDNDGDPDLLLAVNFMDRRDPNRFTEKITDGSAVNRERLYRNDWNEQLGHPVFTDVTNQSGLIWEGYSHSLLVTDFNRDGWLDIYVANDYVTNDLCYLNNRDGTFTNRIADMFKHQAGSAMGTDLADVDNDGQLDLFTTEMLPYYNKRKKLFLGPNNYAVYVNNEEYGYEYQYPRNVFQVQRGIDPETGLPRFSDVSFLTGTQETEWSWTPLLADFDNDGYRDLFVTNGFPRDVTDHDFALYHSTVAYLVPPLELQEAIPQVKTPKFLFQNKGNLHFEDRSKDWGVSVPAFSNGAAYADLDNDGDLDLVVNNIDDPAFVFQNTLNDGKQKINYLRLRLEGRQKGDDAFGAEATIFFNGQRQTAQLLSARGYNSASENILHFGLGTATSVDSIQVRWNGNETCTLRQVAANQTLTVQHKDIRAIPPASAPHPLFVALDPTATGLDYVHQEPVYVDFNVQRTLPRQYSQSGPLATVGDANGDGLDDLYLGGSEGVDGCWFFQKKDGTFEKQVVCYKTNPKKREEETGVLLFDADGDRDLDLYLVRGGAQYPSETPEYQDVLCVNDGKGHFTLAPEALPQETACGKTVKAADFDGDGDLDLFVGGSMFPRQYPKPDRSFLLRNDGQGSDNPRFTDITEQYCPALAHVGMVSDALWTDFDGDKRPDLLLAGEWMPLTFLRNTGNRLENITAQTGIAKEIGWWSCLAAADFDRDGDMDYVAGNLGLNTYFQCHAEEPLHVYAKDFDKNGDYDPFISCYWFDSLGRRREYFYHTRDDMLRQMISLRKKFNGYGDFGEATVQDMLSKEQLEGALILQATQMASCFVENKGQGKFALTPLPWQAQLAPLQAISTGDADGDGALDILMVGNDYGMELLQGRADAFNGLVLRNTGQNRFQAVDMAQSGFVVPFDARALVQLRGAKGQDYWVATQNRGRMRVFGKGH